MNDCSCQRALILAALALLAAVESGLAYPSTTRALDCNQFVAEWASETHVPTFSELNRMRCLFAVQPQRAYEAISDEISRDRELKKKYGIVVSRQGALEYLEDRARNSEGQAFLTGNSFVSALVDTMRLRMMRGTVKVDPDQLRHLDWVSRVSAGVPFLTGNEKLAAMLERDRIQFFHHPSDFSERHIDRLNNLSLLVTGLPFLRGDPHLVARIESLRTEYNASPELFNASSLDRLNRVSDRVIGQPFSQSLQLSGYVFTVVGFLIAGLLVLVVFRPLLNPLLNPSSWAEIPGEPSNRIALEEACELLGVAPDCSRAELRRAFRRLQKSHHPDVVAQHGGFDVASEQRAREINLAYEMIRERLTNRSH